MSYDTVDKRSEDDSRLWPRVGAREDGCGTCVHAGSNTLRGHTSIGNEVGGEDWLWDATLPMGIRSGCAIFKAFSSAVEFLAEKRGCGPMSHLLDDFLWIALNQQGAQRKIKLFQKLCEILGIPIIEHKTEWGTTLVFLGIELDTIKMQAILPEEKLKKCLGLLKRHGQSKKITVSH